MVNLLRNVRLFETFSEAERADLVHFMHERRFDAGETVCARGQHGSTMMVVVQGALSAVVAGNQNHHAEVARLQAGAVLGEMYCIDPAPRPVTVVASEDTTVFEIGHDDLTRMREEAPRSAAALVSAVFYEVLRRLRDVDDRVDRELCAGPGDVPGTTADGSPAERSASCTWDSAFPRLRGSA
jgi:CRP/FNR family cyclic AMP-dependent transcriptional regulator